MKQFACKSIATHVHSNLCHRHWAL